MTITYTLNDAIGKREQFDFDGIVSAGDILQFEGMNKLYVVTKRTLDVPFDISLPITRVTLETKPYEP
ncbi:hypothetical protein [Pseudomonas sp. TWP3-2]|uniref:hypothetical protein n=1 Tax=Pseudomonas sp. TWP3-2 TaxID=2804574 RepID=UPI003CF980F1